MNWPSRYVAEMHEPPAGIPTSLSPLPRSRLAWSGRGLMLRRGRRRRGGPSLRGVAIEGNKIKCDSPGCSRTTPLEKTATGAKNRGWYVAEGTDTAYCPEHK